MTIKVFKHKNGENENAWLYILIQININICNNFVQHDTDTLCIPNRNPCQMIINVM